MREHTLFCQERFHARVWGYRWPTDFISCWRNTDSTPSKQAGTGGRKELLRRGDKCRGRGAIEIPNTTKVSVLQDWRTLSSSHHGLLPRVFMGPCGEKQKGRWCCRHRAIHKKEMPLFLVVLVLSLWCWGWNLLARATSFYGYLLFQTLTAVIIISWLPELKWLIFLDSSVLHCPLVNNQPEEVFSLYYCS